MGACISKQPNGLLCRFSTVVDCPTDWNMTEEDYIAMVVENAVEEAKHTLKNHLHPFSDVIESTHPNNMTTVEIVNMFEDMGYNPTEDEVKGWKDWEEDLD